MASINHPPSGIPAPAQSRPLDLPAEDNQVFDDFLIVRSNPPFPSAPNPLPAPAAPTPRLANDTDSHSR
ncbi:MAG: hypothetical protein SynsKO_08790 [Synoicihabitans sp.]